MSNVDRQRCSNFTQYLAYLLIARSQISYLLCECILRAAVTWPLKQSNNKVLESTTGLGPPIKSMSRLCAALSPITHPVKLSTCPQQPHHDWWPPLEYAFQWSVPATANSSLLVQPAITKQMRTHRSSYLATKPCVSS